MLYLHDNTSKGEFRQLPVDFSVSDSSGFQHRQSAVVKCCVDKRNAVYFPLDIVLHDQVRFAAACQHIACFFQQLLRLRYVQLETDSELNSGILCRTVIPVAQDFAEKLLADFRPFIYLGILTIPFSEKIQQIFRKRLVAVPENVVK